MDTFQIQATLRDIRNIMGQQSNNEIVKQTLDIWSKMVKEYNMEGDIKSLICPALGLEFTPEISDAEFGGWWDKGITVVCTITEEGIFKSFGQLQKEFGLENKDFFRYLQIRDYYDKRIKPTLSGEDNTLIDVLIEAYRKKNKKINNLKN